MKRIIVFLVLLIATTAFAGPPGAPPVGPGTELQVKTIKPVQFTVATLPTLAAGDVGTLAAVSDGDGATDCVTGGGTDRVMCRWTGSAWENAGDGQAAGSAEVSDAPVGAAGDTDTSHAYSKDDIHDYVAQHDGDYDGLDDAVEAGSITLEMLNNTSIPAFMETILDDGDAATVLATLGIDSAANLETSLSLGAYASDLLGFADADAVQSALAIDDLVTLSGVAEGAANLGTFTGTTITDSQTIKVALQELETAVEAAGAADAFTVKVDAGATAGYIGATYDAGAIRTDGTAITKTDGGDYVTIGAQAYLLDIAGLTLAEGDILYFDGTDVTNLGHGVAGQFLETQGASNPPRWGDPSGSGDITKVGDGESGNVFTGVDADGNTANSLWFEGTTANNYEVRLTAANPGADVVVTIPAATGTLLLANGDGSALTSVDAATGDSATAFFDAGAIETNYGGTGADLSAVTGIMGINAGTYVDVDTAAELETYAGLGAFANEYLDDANAAAMLATLGIDSAANLESSLSLGAYASDILGSADADAFAALTGMESALEGVLDLEDMQGAVTDGQVPNDITINTATLATNITASANNSTDETVYPVFVDGATGTQGAETDTGLTYNPSTGVITATKISVTDVDYSGDLTYTGSGDQTIQLGPITAWAPEGATPMIAFEGASAPYALKFWDGSTENALLNSASSITWTSTTHDFSDVTNFVLPTAVADASGEISISTGNQLKWHDGAKVVTIDTTNTNDNYVLKYDNASATFNLEADADSGGAPAWSAVTDPTADAEIEMGIGEETRFLYTGDFTTGAQFLIEQLTGNPTGGVLLDVKAADSSITVMRVGDGTNVWTTSTAGRMANAGTADINFAAAGDILVAGSQIDFDDMAGSANISTSGSITGSDLIIGDAGNIGSASDTDAIAIAANGEVTLSQELQSSGGIDASTGTVILGTVTGTIDASGATSLEIPNGTNPTTGEGIIAYDTDDNAIEVDSMLINPVVTQVVTIAEPDQRTDDLVLWHFPSEAFPHGATITYISISTSASASDTHTVEEWDDRAGTTQTTVDSVALSTSQLQEETTISDAAMAADSWLVLNLDDSTDDVDYMEVTFSYYMTPGD